MIPVTVLLFLFRIVLTWVFFTSMWNLLLFFNFSELYWNFSEDCNEHVDFLWLMYIFTIFILPINKDGLSVYHLVSLISFFQCLEIFIIQTFHLVRFIPGSPCPLSFYFYFLMNEIVSLTPPHYISNSYLESFQLFSLSWCFIRATGKELIQLVIVSSFCMGL